MCFWVISSVQSGILTNQGEVADQIRQDKKKQTQFGNILCVLSEIVWAVLWSLINCLLQSYEAHIVSTSFSTVCCYSCIYQELQ